MSTLATNGTPEPADPNDATTTLDVLVVVGTDDHPFDRLIDWIDAWAATRPHTRVLQQIGTSHPPAHTRWVRLLTIDELHANLAASALVVTHGGPGTISDTLAHGRRPVVVPRDPVRGEHIDDHQLRFAREVVARGDGLIATSENALREHLDRGLDEPDRYRCPPQTHDATAAIAHFDALVAMLQPQPRRRGGRIRAAARRA